jgi:hypothetical protein
MINIVYERKDSVLNSKKQTLGIVMGIIFAGAIIAGKFFAGNMLAQFLKDFLSSG